jgi:hypothetical protein
MKFAVLALLCLSSSAAFSQEVVHAVSGVVTAVDHSRNAINIKTNDGSEGDFQYLKELKTSIEFDKSLREGTADPGSFNKVGDHVVAYYFLAPGGRTLVALKDFGPNGLSVASGTVMKDHHHAITIKTDAGASETFEMAKDASVETSVGVEMGSHFDAEEGRRITVRYTVANGVKTAEFIRAD